MNSQSFLSWCRTFSSPSTFKMPLVMGILNVTPDSFSDGGRFLTLNQAAARVDEMLAEGVDMIDIGGESTRPGAHCVSTQEELDRVIPVIEKIRSYSDITISIDTSKPDVMREAITSGATLINDVNALMAEGALATACALNVPVCLMHKQGMPLTMQDAPIYSDGVLPAIHAFFKARIDTCLAGGILPQHLLLDPGFGFGKTSTHNLVLTKELLSFTSYGFPVLYAASRKSTIGTVLNRDVSSRLFGGLGLAVYAALQGASIIRTHDVAATKDALIMVTYVENAIEKGEV